MKGLLGLLLAGGLLAQSPIGIPTLGGGGASGGGSGTVTSVATTGPITGGPFTTTGTIGCATCGVTGSPLSQFASTTSAQLIGIISDANGTGTAVFGTSPTIITPTFTTTGTLNNNGVVADTPGYILQNTTAAAVGVQEVSPAVTLIGQGWKTTATAASQTVKWDIYTLPLQSSTSPATELIFQPTVNGSAGAVFGLCNLTSASSVGAIMELDAITSNGCSNNGPGGGGSTGFGPVNAGNVFGFFTNTTERGNFNNNGILLTNTAALMFTSAGAAALTTGDVTLDRDAAGVLGIQSGAQGTTAANYRDLKLRLEYRGLIYSAAGTALPTCNGGANTAEAVVSDATSPTFLGTYSSGGAVVAPVICNGTNWVTY